LKKYPEDYGFIEYYKKKKIIAIVIMVVLALIIFIIGLLVNDGSKKNVFTVVSILFVLPAAKFLTTLIITLPQKNVAKEEYDKFKSYVSNRGNLFPAVVITSEKKVMYMDYIYVGESEVIGLVNENQANKKRGTDANYVQNYLRDGVNNYADGYKVLVVDSRKKFENQLRDVSKKASGKAAGEASGKVSSKEEDSRDSRKAEVSEKAETSRKAEVNESASNSDVATDKARDRKAEERENVLSYVYSLIVQ